MANIKIIGKKGSTAIRNIVEETGIRRYKGNMFGKVEAIINYGLSGEQLESFFKIYPSAKKLPTINKYVGKAKLSMIREAEKSGIKVPESRLTLPDKSDPKDWIEKKQNSIGGIGIKYASGKRKQIPGKYFQKFIKNRRYEIRVHAFSWMKDWSVQKRRGTHDEIAWNFHNGGIFSQVRTPKNYKIFSDALEVSRKILSLGNMSFGAVDFIVDEDLNLYFIEINSAPGFQELSKDTYIEAFNTLKNMKIEEIRRYTN
jgi:hypothetical protein